MKQTISQRFFQTLCLMIVGCLWGSAAWAETATYQHVFTVQPSTGNNVTLSNVAWNISATNLNGYNSQYYAGVQFGTSKKNGQITLTSSSDWNYNGKTKIKEVRLWLNRGGTSVTPTVTIGNKAATSDGTTVVKNSSAGEDWTKTSKVTFTPAADGNTGVIEIDVNSVKAGYICALEIDCEDDVLKSLSSVAVSGAPTKTTYEAGDAFDPAGLVVTGTYSDGSNATFTEDITWNVTPETLTAGLTSVDVTATVDGVTSDKYPVTGLTVTAARTLSSVTLEGKPTKTTYYVGETFDPTGIKVMANYTTGDPEDVTAEATFNYNNSALAFGTSSMTVSATFEGKTSTEQNYTITVNKKASSISIADLTIGVDETSTIPATTTPADAVLSYTITDGSEYVTLDGNQLTGSALGTATIKASYAGDDEYEAAETSFTVTVSDLKTATINSFSKTSGNFTDNTDISYASYKGDGTSEPALNSNAIRLYKKGSGKTSGGYITITAVDGAMIQSVKLTTGSSKSTTTIGYCVDNEDAPTTGVQVTNPTDYNISNLNKKSVSIYCLDGTNYLEVASLEVKYTKEKLTLSSIALSGEYQTVFTQYDDFNHENLVVTATYSNGSTRDVTSLANFSTPDMNTVSTKTVTVSYTEDEVTKEVSYDITVNKKIFSQIEPKTVYRKITSTDDIVDGGVYLIVCESENEAMGVIDNKRCLGATITLNGNTYTGSVNQSDLPYEITITEGKSGSYNLYHAGGKYITSTSTDFTFAATGDDGWSISFDGSGNAIISNKNTEDNFIQRNNSNNYYKNYQSAQGGQTPIQLYQKVGEMSVAKATGGITTFVSNYDYLMPENLTGYIVTDAAEAGVITTKVAYGAGQAVPAYTPLIIKSSEDYTEGETSKTYNPIALNKGLSYTGDANMLEYNRDENGFTKTSKSENVYYYKLAIKSGNVGFYWGAENGVAFEMTKPSTAYLTVPQSMGVQSFALNLEEDVTTGIATVVTDENAPIYNLQGIRMNGKNLPKGIYIQDGKKFMVK
ncbi:MAG: bacterial Ig-like domain-containing protein [Bacteroidales bacterium]|nr:bacterial Ig-like domain-containing protein [Bacteroidales bacterium]